MLSVSLVGASSSIAVADRQDKDSEPLISSIHLGSLLLLWPPSISCDGSSGVTAGGRRGD